MQTLPAILDAMLLMFCLLKLAKKSSSNLFLSLCFGAEPVVKEFKNVEQFRTTTGTLFMKRLGRNACHNGMGKVS